MRLPAKYILKDRPHRAKKRALARQNRREIRRTLRLQVRTNSY